MFRRKMKDTEKKYYSCLNFLMIFIIKGFRLLSSSLFFFSTTFSADMFSGLLQVFVELGKICAKGTSNYVLY